jgi:D-threo-aldose 1-dehydrogenase
VAAVTRLGLGCAPLGNLFAAITDDQAKATVDAAWDAGIRLFDTAPLYGQGLSEIRLGRALHGRPREEYTLSTKVGRLLRDVPDGPWPSIFVDAPELEPVFAYSRDDTLRSIEESLDRLGVDRLDIVHVHDPDDHEDEALRGAFPALLRLRDQGVIGAVGCGMNQWEMLSRFVERVDLDCILLAGRYTLLDRSGADRLLPRCLERRVDVYLGGVFNSGLLADPDANTTYDYVTASPEVIARARAMRAACERHGISLAAAAIQFGLAHPAVTAVLVGARSADEVRADVADAAVHIPDELWGELDG